MKNFTRILIATSLVVMVAFNAYSQDVFRTANVGIGTASPTQKLDVTGNVKFSGALMPNNLPGVAGNILLSGGPSPLGNVPPTWLANGLSGQVLEANGSGIPTWTTLSTSTAWLLAGNSGTTPGTNYLGTSDGASFQFDVNAQYAGSLDPLNSGYSNANVYLGAPSTSAPILGGAGNNDAGQNNVGIGLAALGSSLGKNLTTNGGYGNTSALLTAYDVAIGAYSMSSMQYGSASTAVGAYSQRFANFSGASTVAGGGTLIGGNSSVGAYSLYSSSTGQFNTAIGYYSMYGSGSATAVGNFNTAEGYQSLYTAGANIYSNTAIGSNSLYNNTGNRNTAVGDSALYTNTVGVNNTAIGYQANVGANNLSNTIAIGYQATAPVSNSIALGNSSVSSLYLPGYNTSTGDLLYTSAASGLVSALVPGVAGTVLASSGPGVAPTWLSTSGVNVVSGTPPIYINTSSPYSASSPNVNIEGLPSGADAGGVLYSAGAGNSAAFTSTGTANFILQSNGTSAPSWISNAALATGAWMLTGNTISSAYGINYIGDATQNHPIEFVANGLYQGMIDPYASNFYFGQGTGGDSLAYVNTGSQNVAMGYEAFVNGAGASQIAAIGAEALHFDVGNDNDAVGAYSLHYNTTGIQNDALGYGAGFNNTTGSNNVNVGFEAGYNQTTGSLNVAVGDSALYGGGGTGGTPATYVGSYNTAVGLSALAGIGTGTNGGTGGFYNTALGYDAAIHTSTGNYNTAIGYQAGTANTTGIGNTLVGYLANVSSGNLTNATAIGYQAIAPASNSVTLGNSSTSLYLPGYTVVGDLLYTSAASGQVGQLTPGTSGYVLESQGVGTPPTWLAVTAPNTVTCTAPIYNTNTLTAPVIAIQGLPAGTDQGGVLYSTGAGSSALFTPTGASGFYLISNGTSAPTWGVLTPNGAWSLTGNTVSATYGTNYLGTTNNAQLQFKANGAFAGVLDPTNSNVFFGNGAGPAVYTSEGTIAATYADLVGIGWGALGSVSGTVIEHTAIGYQALHSLTTGNTPTTAVGAFALNKLTTGVPNDAFGFQAGFDMTTGTFNLLMGYDAGYYNQTGVDNVAIGDSSMYGGYPATGVGALYTLSQGNTAVGVSSLAQIASSSAAIGAYNTAVGYEAGLHETTGSYNTSFGVQANYANQKGYGNVAAGYGALFKNTYSGNTAVGTNALYNNNIGSWTSAAGFNGPNVAIGDSAMYANVLGTKNVAVGYAALTSAGATLAGGSSNTAIGFQAMENASGAAVANDVAVGNQALLNYNQTSNDVAVGAFAMYGTVALAGAQPDQDVAIGAYAMYDAGSGANYDIAIGSGTSANAGPLGSTTFTGSDDIAIGFEAGTINAAMTTGSNNTLLGYETYGPITQSGNTIVGALAHAGGTVSTNTYNTAVGYSANAGYNVSVTNATALGYSATATGTGATAVGASSTASGTSSTAIGASSSAAFTNATAIGPSATAGAANALVLGSSSLALNVGIGTNTPARTLEVAGVANTIRVDGLGAGNAFATTSPNATTDQIMFARSTGDLYSMPNTASGYVLTNVSGVPTWSAAASSITATAPIYVSGANVYISSSSGGNGGVLYGTGTGAAFTPPSPATGYVLEGQGPGNEPIWVTLASLAGSGDNWGTQVAITDSNLYNPTENTLTGDGLPGSPLKIAQDLATTGQVLEWNGTTWKPATANTTSSIVNGGASSVVTVTNGVNQVVGNGNVAIDVQAAAGSVIYGTGASATALAAGTTGYVLTSNGAAAPTWAALGANLYWALTGNSGTTPGTNYIGTSDGASFQFRVNAQYAGSLDPLNSGYSNANVYLGAPSTSAPILGGAGNSDAGQQNVGVGLAALGSSLGANLTTNSGYGNSSTLLTAYNVAIGAYSMSSMQYGSECVAVGSYSQRFANFAGATIGIGGPPIGANTSVGSYSLYSNSTGQFNTSIGFQSMYGSGSTTAVGNYNTAEGYNALYTAGAGISSNTAIGSNSLYKTTASHNTAVGDSALASNTGGTYNTALGYDADVSTAANYTNATAIGAFALAAQSNSMVLGSISGVNGATANTNVCIGTSTPDPDAALAIKTNHLETQGNVASEAPGTGVTAVSLTGTDVAGVISFTIPTSAGAGGQVTVTFANAYTVAPTVIITPVNQQSGVIAGTALPYVTSTTTTFTINFGAAAGNGSAEALSFNYFIIEAQ